MQDASRAITQWYHEVISLIDHNLIWTPHAKKLFQMITIEAESNNEYKHDLMKWFQDGGTVFLRDELCLRFQDKFTDELEWFNSWCIIDEIGIGVR